MASPSSKQPPLAGCAPHPIALAACLAFTVPLGAWAQTGTAPTLQAVAVSASKAPPTLEVGGLGDTPLRELPLSATVIDRAQIEALGARRLADLTTTDPSVADAYNAPGYWDFLSVRGFVLDNRFNYRREGLPINAETTIPLDNKSRVEILKGTSGIQAGTSAPGGLVNYVVKRPTEQNLRQVQLELRDRGSALASLDLGGRAGAERQWGYRLNVVHETLRPHVNHLNGQRQLVALATDLRLDRDSVLEAELEWSHKRQPSQQAFSLLGNQLPGPVNPKLNLNNQAWSQPSEFDGLTGTVRYERSLNAQWRLLAQVGSQALRSDDRLAYAFGCSSADQYDRFCADGSYDLYDFRSENERRRQQAAQLQLKGQIDTGAVRHDLSWGLLASRVNNRFQDQAYNWVGYGNVLGTAMLPADPTLTDVNTNRQERSLELSVQDAIRWSPQLTTWLGLRHTRLSRDSVRTNGSRPTHYDQSLTTPFLAATYQVAPQALVYGSWGQGVESQVVPNKPSQYLNAGQALPALKSKQIELGYRRGPEQAWWQVAVFRIERPMTNLDACSRLGLTPCLGQFDGDAVHQGMELSGHWQQGAWTLDGGLGLLKARRQGSSTEPAVNGQRPTNVPDWVLRSQLQYRFDTVPGLSAAARVSHEGSRLVLPDGSLKLPAWTRVDLALRYATRLQGHATTWTLGIDNLLDRRYWKESPYQYGHVFLYPGSARSLRVNFSADF